MGLGGVVTCRLIRNAHNSASMIQIRILLRVPLEGQILISRPIENISRVLPLDADVRDGPVIWQRWHPTQVVLQDHRMTDCALQGLINDALKIGLHLTPLSLLALAIAAAHAEIFLVCNMCIDCLLGS